MLCSQVQNMSSKKKGRGIEAIQKEDVIQAVLIADSYNVRFAPLTSNKPRVLLPLANIPLLEYSLECLAAAEVQEVFLYCTSHSDQIKEHMKNSKWSKKSSSMAVNIIVSENCRSLGDALRDLDTKAVISNDFILMMGDVVSNVQLQPILNIHKEYVKQEKGTAMTLIYKHVTPGHLLRCPEEEMVVAIDPATNRLLHHQRIGGLKRLAFPLEVFVERSKVDLRHDLLDCHVCICSAAVPPLFSDNFDYQTLDDLVRGLLINEEIMGNMLYSHILEREYAAQVSNLHMYHAVSRDVMHRWTYPLVPDLLATPNNSDSYVYLKHNIYKQPSITLSRSCKLEEDVIVGAGSSIGENTFISHSVIGRNCVIGSNVKIVNSYIWDNVTIQNNCIIDFSLVADNSVLKENVILKPNCVIGSNSVIGPNWEAEKMRVIAEIPTESNDEYSSNVATWKKVGEKGFEYQAPVDSDSDAESLVEETIGLKIESEKSESETGSEESDASSDRMSPVADDTKIFLNEVLDSLVRGFEEKLKCDNLILEINSSRYAYNVSVKEVNHLVTQAILSIPSHQTKDDDVRPNDLLVKLKDVLNYFLPIFQNYIKTPEAQTDCLSAMEEYSGISSSYSAILLKVLHFLYNKDILSEEVILEWYEGPHENPTTGTSIRKQVEPFIKWLEEADEETDSEEEHSD